MKIRTIVDEVFQDYKKTAMMIVTCKCDWKCMTEQGLSPEVCQNYHLTKEKDVDMPDNEIIKRYTNNKITNAIVINGLEPFLQFGELVTFIDKLRQVCNDDIVIYTGYYPHELGGELKTLKRYKNIIIKFGRYIPNRNKIYDNILGVELISDNQFALKIS